MLRCAALGAGGVAAVEAMRADCSAGWQGALCRAMAGALHRDLRVCGERECGSAESAAGGRVAAAGGCVAVWGNVGSGAAGPILFAAVDGGARRCRRGAPVQRPTVRRRATAAPHLSRCRPAAPSTACRLSAPPSGRIARGQRSWVARRPWEPPSASIASSVFCSGSSAMARDGVGGSSSVAILEEKKWSRRATPHKKSPAPV